MIAFSAFISSAAAQFIPVIIQQPLPKNVARGTSTGFNVVIGGGVTNVFYQWRLNGDSVPGATNSSITITNVQTTNAGSYSVVAYNSFGAVNSQPALLSLTDVPQFALSDMFSNSIVITSDKGILQGTNNGASSETNEPPHAGKPARRSVWLTWVAPTQPGIVTFRTAGSSFDTVLAAYTGNSLGQLTAVEGDDDGGGFFTSEISFRPDLQRPYRIAIDGLGGASGRIVLEWTFEPTTDVLPVIVTQPLDQTVAPNTDVVFTVEGSPNDRYLWVFNGLVLSNQTASGLTVKTVGPADVGTYYCQVNNGKRTRNSQSARLQLNSDDSGRADPAAFASDKLFDSRLRASSAKAGLAKVAKVVAHGFSGTQIYSTLGSSKEAGEPNHCGIAGGASEWFTYQPTDNGTLYLNTDGSTIDTVLAVYVGPGDEFLTLTNVACDNDSGLDGKDSRASLPATAGTIYWIAVDGVNNPISGLPARGTIALNYRVVQPLRLSSTVHTNTAGGRLTFKITGTPNLPATIQGTTNLAADNWVSLFTNSTPSGVFNYTNTGTGAHTNRFFRAINRF